MAQGGDVFVLDMSEPIRIVDLARKMVHLMGFAVRDEKDYNGDIPIEYIGLRAGEKLHEELLVSESVTGTEHPKIMRAQEEAFDWQVLEPYHDRLEAACQPSKGLIPSFAFRNRILLMRLRVKLEKMTQRLRLYFRSLMECDDYCWRLILRMITGSLGTF
jgi:hypothetical protein